MAIRFVNKPIILTFDINDIDASSIDVTTHCYLYYKVKVCCDTIENITSRHWAPLKPESNLVTLYQGKVFVNDTKFSINLSTIFKDFCWNGEHLIAPVFNENTQNYAPEYSTIDEGDIVYYPIDKMGISENIPSLYFPAEFVVEFYTQPNGASKILFVSGYGADKDFPNILFGYVPDNKVLKNGITPPCFSYGSTEQGRGSVKKEYLLDNLTNELPHIPSVRTDNYFFGALVNYPVEFFKSKTQISPVLYIDRTVYVGNKIDSFKGYSLRINKNDYGVNVFSIPLSVLFDENDGCAVDDIYLYDTQTSLATSNDIKLAIVDTCNKDFYIAWQDELGNYNSYGFDGKHIHTLKQSNETLVDFYDFERVTHTNWTENFKLNSGIVNKERYLTFQSLLTSKWIYVYDTQLDKGYYCTIKTSSFDSKEVRYEKRPLNFEIELEASEKYSI